jgi:nitrite reductase/ring-hydroxylating ferredoxin subunit/uncharacterized membrane protein
MLNLNKVLDQTVERIPGLDDTGLRIARGIQDVVLRGGEPTRSVVDILHGKGLGAPLHPILTDVTIGGWVFSVIFDLIWLSKRSRAARLAADTSLRIGTLSAIATALSGLADYTTIPGRSAGTGLLHALFNLTNVVLFGASVMLRRYRKREPAVALSLIGMGTVGLAAMLGGHMVFSQRVGVNHDQPVEPLPEWTPVQDLDALIEVDPKRVDIQGHPILLYRQGERVYAISAICSHDGGPLYMGKFTTCPTPCTVECPLHQSVFDLRNGNVVHGPATQAVTSYETRINNGKVEVRLPYATK